MFLALAESLNFSKSAEQLFMTQPALSKAIREIEGTLGLPLFERTTRSVQLTEGGAKLLPVARTIVGEYEAGLQRLRTSAQQEALQLAIAALPSFAHALMPSVCAALEREHPAVQITVHDCSNGAAIKRLLNYEVDFALASVAPSHPDLMYQELLRDRFVLLSCPPWSRQVRARMHLDELMDLPLITLTNASTALRYISAAYLQRGVEFRPKMQMDQVGTIAAFVRKGLGIAVLPYLGMLPIGSLRGMQLSEVVDGPVRSLGLVTRRTGSRSPLVTAAMQAVQDASTAVMERHPAWILPPHAQGRKPRGAAR